MSDGVKYPFSRELSWEEELIGANGVAMAKFHYGMIDGSRHNPFVPSAPQYSAYEVEFQRLEDQFDQQP